MHLVADLRISFEQTGDPPRLAAIVSVTKDGEPVGEPCEPVPVAPGLVLSYGPIGLECTVDSHLSVNEGENAEQPEQPQPKKPEPPKVNPRYAHAVPQPKKQ